MKPDVRRVSAQPVLEPTGPADESIPDTESDTKPVGSVQDEAGLGLGDKERLAESEYRRRRGSGSTMESKSPT